MSSSVNKVILIGNLCQEPNVKEFDNGGVVAQFSLATNTPGSTTKDGKEVPERAEFHNIVVNRKGLAGVVQKYLHKGNKIYVEGELRTRQYESQTGEKHYITEVYVNNLIMLGSGKGNKQDAPMPEPEPEPGYVNDYRNDDDFPF